MLLAWCPVDGKRIDGVINLLGVSWFRVRGSGVSGLGFEI